MYKKIILVSICSLLMMFCIDSFGQNFGNEFVTKSTPAAKQVWIIVQWVCGLTIGGSVLSLGYKLYQSKNNDVKIELILLLTFIGVFFITPVIIEWIAKVKVN